MVSRFLPMVWKLARYVLLAIKWGSAAVAVFGFIFWARWTLDPPDPLLFAGDTTLIEGPITAEGIPDYGAYVLEQMKGSVLPEENGAIEFWQAMGPAAIEETHRDVFFAELGCPVPDQSRAMSPLFADATQTRLNDWLRDRQSTESSDQLIARQSDRVIKLSCKRLPATDFPTAIKAWIEENEQPLDLLVRSATKPAYYSPPPNLLSEPRPCLLDANLPGVVLHREASRALAIRTMSLLDAGERDAALKQALAIIRLGDRLCAGQLLLTQLIGSSVSAVGFDTLRVVIDTSDQIEEVLAVIEHVSDMEEYRWAKRGMSGTDWMSSLDCIVRAHAGATDTVDDVPSNMPRYSYFIDINRLLRRVNRYRTEMIAIAANENRVERRARADSYEAAFEKEIVAMADSYLPFAAVLSRRVHSDCEGMALRSILFPNLSLVVRGEDSVAAKQRLTLLAAQLKLHCLREGKYPETLDTLSASPLDPFTNEPFRYERRGNGFVIYSLGINGVDDGASDQKGDFVDGNYAPIDWFDERPTPDAGYVPGRPDDIVVRLPVPRLELPDFVTN